MEDEERRVLLLLKVIFYFFPRWLEAIGVLTSQKAASC